MQYIATLNYLCTRRNEALCTQILDACTVPLTRADLGVMFKNRVDSSKLSRYLSDLASVGLLNNIDSLWKTDSRYPFTDDNMPFRIIAVNGIAGEILRLFGAQFKRGRQQRPAAGGSHDVPGPRASLTIKSISVVLGVSREVIQLRLAELVEMGILTRNTRKRPYTYALSLEYLQ